ncbi:MAG: pyridoxamine 5'-phosphate oxidase family protein [Alphaproteobacteria bacterium]|nr:pyridoxamine 5'-phosphate oxidase family protein [Alphaproteobacteria bacterium]
MTPSSNQKIKNNYVTSLKELNELYGKSPEGAIKKEIDHISDKYKKFIEASPFVIIATSGPGGLDCSPRGDPPGFVKVINKKTLLIPDRRGNNRVDSLTNIIQDPRISLLFLIPGIGETIRINGSAKICVDADLCNSFSMNGKNPKSIIEVIVGSIYYQCPKALVRSKLWDPNSQIEREQLPTTGSILESITEGRIDGKEYDKAYPKRLKDTIY